MYDILVKMSDLRSSAGKASFQSRISDDYLAGFVDGEGMFYIGIVRSPETKTGWQVIYFFKVSQNPSGRGVLDYFQKRLSCGYVKQNSKTDKTDKSLAFVVRDLPSLRDIIIPFFEGKLHIKGQTFEKFKRVIELVADKKHLTKEGITKVLEIAYSMNTQKRRVSRESILQVYRN
jgi:hypothetical protein